MLSWKSVVGKLWMTIMGLVALVLVVLGLFLMQYIDMNFANSNDVKNLFIYAAIMGFLLTTFFAVFLSTRITKPLLELKKAADSISKGDYETKVKIYSSDEIGQLGKAFNLMGQQLEETINDLTHEKEHLGSVLRSMTDAVITFDAAGHIILYNPQGESLLQEWGAIAWDEELTGTNNFNVLDQAVPEPLQEIYETVITETKEITENLHVHKGVFSVVMTPLYTQNMVRGAVAVLRDVTEEHRLDKLRKDFVANVSHELKTPLSMLQGYSEALIDDIAGTPEERKELAQIILDESLRMNRLVEDLLDLATMEAGHLNLHFDDVNINELLDRMVRKFAAVAKERHIELQFEKPERIVMLRCDEDRLEQVLTNLIDNAIRHTDQAAKVVIRQNVTEYKGKPSLLIEVEDEGTGIHAEDLVYIFERFYKADKARTREHTGGTGLGLSIVKNIIEAHGGTVYARSVFGQGTTFSLYIPL